MLRSSLLISTKTVSLLTFYKTNNSHMYKSSSSLLLLPVMKPSAECIGSPCHVWADAGCVWRCARTAAGSPSGSRSPATRLSLGTLSTAVGGCRRRSRPPRRRRCSRPRWSVHLRASERGKEKQSINNKQLFQRKTFKGGSRLRRKSAAFAFVFCWLIWQRGSRRQHQYRVLPLLQLTNCFNLKTTAFYLYNL